MRSQTNTFRLSLVFLLLLGASARGQKQLRWKLQPSQTFRVNFEQKTVTETTGAGKPTGITINNQMQMTWKVESVEGGTMVMTQHFDRLSLMMKSGDAAPIEYDSASEQEPSGSAKEIAATVEPLIEAAFTVTMDHRGAIRDVQLSEAAAKALESTDSAKLKQLFSAEGISRILSESAVEFPEGAVNAGDSWEANSETKSPLGLIKQLHTYTFAGAEDVDGTSLDKVTLKSVLEIAKDKNVPSKLKLLQQERTGKLLFDSEAGRMVRSESTQKLTTERPYRDLKIKVVTTSSSVMTIEPE